MLRLYVRSFFRQLHGLDMTDFRIQVTAARLHSLAQTGASIPLKNLVDINSNQVGNHDDERRGQGHDLIDLREYQPGDDIRNIDWKTTLKTGHHHIRVFADQKKKSARIIVDLRHTMRFASQGSLKSVQACELAALISGYLQSHTGTFEFHIILEKTHFYEAVTPEKLALVLEHSFTQSLEQKGEAGALNQVVSRLCEQHFSDEQIIIISDFHGCGSNFRAHCAALASSNKLLGFYIQDPLEVSLPKSRLLLGDEVSQVDINKSQQELRQRYAEKKVQHREMIEQAFQFSRSELISVTTNKSCEQQLLQMV